MSDPKAGSDMKISRRDFAVSAALATAAIAAVPTDVLAQEKTAEEAAKPEAPQPPKLSAASQAEVEARYVEVLRKYGSRLSEAQKKDVHRLLLSQQQGLDQIRAFPLENWDEPATVFKAAINAKGREIAMVSTDILFLSVRELGQRIKSKQLSPVELTEAYLERSRTLGARLNAYATLTPDLAMQQARAAEGDIKAGKYRGPLHGIPYAAKDLLAVKGYPTSWGARPYANQKFDQDATVIKKLEQAGAVLLGKAAMIELAGGMGYRFASASISGAAKNPWNEGCWTCGSSSGSGAIVSAGLAAFAIGTESWGSIVCPSSFTGISGLRPTYGRVSRHGAMALAYSMDKIGPMARSAVDCGMILAAIAGHDDDDRASLPRDLASFQFPQRVEGKLGSLRIGWLDQKMIAPGGEAVIKDAVAVVNSVGRVTEAKLPEGPWEAAAGIVISVEGAAAFDSLIESGKVADLVDPSGRIGGYVNQAVPSADFVRTQRIRGVLQTKMMEMFANYDLLVSATLPVTASKLEENLEEGLNFPDPMGGIGNFLGLPAISVPCGFAENKMPLGLQFVAAPLNEHLVLHAANAFQAQTDWHKRRPPLG